VPARHDSETRRKPTAGDDHHPRTHSIARNWPPVTIGARLGLGSHLTAVFATCSDGDLASAPEDLLAGGGLDRQPLSVMEPALTSDARCVSRKLRPPPAPTKKILLRCSSSSPNCATATSVSKKKTGPSRVRLVVCRRGGRQSPSRGEQSDGSTDCKSGRAIDHRQCCEYAEAISADNTKGRMPAMRVRQSKSVIA
jgi:hypothetical protein